jgi:hypothetical protein
LIGTTEVGVMAKRSMDRGDTGAVGPDSHVLARHLIRRTKKRADGEPTGSASLKPCERGPHGIVERTLDVTSHNRAVHPGRRDDHPATLGGSSSCASSDL